jgi:hypothetical protein
MMLFSFSKGKQNLYKNVKKNTKEKQSGASAILYIYLVLNKIFCLILYRIQLRKVDKSGYHWNLFIVYI